MNNDNDIRHGRNCVFKMHVHLVFVAKYRRGVFDGDVLCRLRTITGAPISIVRQYIEQQQTPH